MRSCVVAVVVALAGCSSVSAPPAPVETLVQTERDFAALSAAQNAKVAFLEYLADDGVVFRAEGAVRGKDVWSNLPTPKFRLTWRPVHALAAQSGDLGFTTGPYENTRADGKVATGWYASVWRVQPDGRWKLTCDLGAAVKAPAIVPPDWSTTDVDRTGTPDRTASFDAVLQLERDLSERAQRDGVRAVYDRAAAPRIVLLRDGIEPAVGHDAALAALQGAALRWAPVGGGISKAGDLAFVHGRFHEAGKDGSYMRVWRRDGRDWRIVLDSFSRSGG